MLSLLSLPPHITPHNVTWLILPLTKAMLLLTGETLIVTSFLVDTLSPQRRSDTVTCAVH